LHNDREKFVQLVIAVSDATNIKRALVEKDYFVTLFLSCLKEKEPLLVFKGGTCLSKCFKIVKRFSEDIDINLEDVNELTHSRKRMLKKHIVDVIDDLKLSLKNPEQVRSGRDHNIYRISYPAAFTDPSIKQHLEVESYFMIGSFPVVEMSVSSLIHDHLNEGHIKGTITDSGPEPFNIRVQVLERTFVDKIFAICDYHINEKTDAQSRHLYDLHKILPQMTLDEGLKDFVEEIRKAREGKRDCPSAEKDRSLPNMLERIVTENTYKNDYNTITSPLLYEKVSYDEVIGSIRKITDWLKQ
jgi:predicted nucleotidyltransferase component of viral defense system